MIYYNISIQYPTISVDVKYEGDIICTKNHESVSNNGSYSKTMSVNEKQKELMDVIMDGSTYIDNYEKNLVKDAINASNKKIALKMKEDGVNSDFIFKYFGLKI